MVRRKERVKTPSYPRCIVEQDLHPCDIDKPLPIARRTREYSKACGMQVTR